ncbi:hypothetical protein [Dactylosporangium sp. NPDC049140]|uniref:hypothetical protein n=1 Tax=Dactylosporangium sp. NPDC049140 TaxID=3155647 RepID=UPI0034068466
MTSPDADARMACRVCGLPLNRYVDLDTGQVRYQHPARVVAEPAGHRPDPAPLDDVDARHVCDFCSDERIAYTFHTVPISAVVDTAGGQVVERYGTDWSACFPCAMRVRDRDLDGLQQRLHQTAPHLDPIAAGAARVMQQAVLQSLLPGITVANLGRWPATPLPAATLPKVRDRLANLLTGPVGLPLGLTDPAVRGPVADSLRAARLFWIDPEFTELAEYAAGSLPATHLTAADVPAPHGLLAWAHPVGPRADLVAASWTSGPHGLRVVGYRSIGAGLPAEDLQPFREQLGWLGPRVHAQLPPGEPVDASSPAAALVTTWLLIAQRLTETTPAPVDKAIRKAYRRNGRPDPEVRLVRIRGASTVRPAGDAASPHRSADDRPARSRDHRWWVKAHWRGQPYGPGRTLRRPLLVLPQLRGPDDKPIRASTVVRMLAAAPPPPEQPRHGDGQQPTPTNDSTPTT